MITGDSDRFEKVAHLPLSVSGSGPQRQQTERDADHKRRGCQKPGREYAPRRRLQTRDAAKEHTPCAYLALLCETRRDSRKAKKHNQMTPLALFCAVSVYLLSTGGGSREEPVWPRPPPRNEIMRPLSGLWGALLGLHAATALVSPLCNPPAKGECWVHNFIYSLI